jgi:hypothetical protein
MVLGILATPLFGQVPGPEEITCPVDGYRVRISSLETSDRGGGMDSDGCLHDLRGDTLGQMVVVCPRCNYAASRTEFAAPLKDDQKRRVLSTLAGSTYRGVVDGLTDIPGWERFRLAAKCAAALGNAAMEATYNRFAAWSARAEAVKPATVAYSSYMRLIAPLGGRINELMSAWGVEDVCREIEEKIAATKKPEEQNRLRLYLAMMCERGGFAAKRDEAVAGLERSMGADASMRAAVDLFKRLVAIEADFQKKLVPMLGKAPGKDEPRTDHAMRRFLLADTLRRLGRNAEAVDEYRAARRLMSQPTQFRSYTDHFLSMLAPGEPLPTPEPEKPVEMTPPGPETKPAVPPAAPDKK